MSNEPIIIVEDDQTLAEAYAEILALNGHICHLIHDGQAAIAYLETHQPHLVLLDCHLPYASGIDILKFIRATDRLKKTRVVFLSADMSIIDEVQPLADAVLNKPIDVSVLMDIPDRFPDD